MGPVAYGIDFGTTNSSIAVAFDDGTIEVVPLSGAYIESAILLNRTGQRRVGRAALDNYSYQASAKTICADCNLVIRFGNQLPTSDCREFGKAIGCSDSRLLLQIKSAFSDPSYEKTHSWGKDYSVSELAAIVIKFLKEKADTYVGSPITTAAFGRPVRFVGATGSEFRHKQELAEARLREAAQAAGFSTYDLVPESQAAVALDQVDDGTVLTTDFGGGTFDVAVLRVRGSHAQVLSLDGVGIGGEDFDQVLFEKFVAPALDIAADSDLRAKLPGQVRKYVSSLSGLLELQRRGTALTSSKPLTSSELDALRQLRSLIDGGAIWPLFEQLRLAKHKLSEQPTAELVVKSGHFRLTTSVQRHIFEAGINPMLAELEKSILRAISNAGMVSADIDTVTTTGGSAQIPAYLSLLGSLFPTAEMVKLDPTTTVVRGLATYAFERWSSRD